MFAVIKFLKKNIRFNSIQSQITVAFSCLILLTALMIVMITYKLWISSVETNSREYTKQLIQQVNTNIDSYITYMENISQMATNNSDIKKYLSNTPSASANEKQDLEQVISGQFDSILSVRKDISNIIIFGPNGSAILSNKNLSLNPYVVPQEQSWYMNAIEANGKPVISSSHVQNVVANDYRWVVSLSRGITVDNQQPGVLLVDLNYSVINDMCSKINLGKRGYIFIVNDKGNIIYHPQQQLIYSNLKTEMIDKVINSKNNYFVTNEGSDSRMYTIINSPATGWKIVGVAYVDEQVPNKKQMQTYYFFGALGLLVFAVIISMIISSTISRPIKKLELSMKEVEKGNFDGNIDIQSSNEIGKLSGTFKLMTKEIKELMQQNTIEQELKRKSEIKALQTQINPHFLYNTLDSIIWMAEDKKYQEVILMTSALAKLFRLSISSGEELTTIENEIEHIKSYLTIQKMRYKDKLDYEIDVDDEILQNKIIKILLQPLVENCIYHGTRNMQEEGLIRITGKRYYDKILIQIIDNGIGMTPDQVNAIFENRKETKSGVRSVGVNNVNDRIKLYFGKEYGLSYESKVDVGTTVSILMPVVK